MRRKKSALKVFRIIGDMLFVNLSFFIAFYIRFGGFPTKNIQAYTRQIPFITIFAIILFSLYNLYSEQLKKDYADIFYAFIPATFLIVLFSISLSYFIESYAFPRSVFIIVIPVMILVMIAWRYLSLKIEQKISQAIKVVIIGQDGDTAKIIKNINSCADNFFIITDVFTEEGFEEEKEDFKMDCNFNLTIGLDNLLQKLSKINPELVFISGRLNEELKKDLFYHSVEEEWEANLVPDFYEIMLSGADIEQLGELPIFKMKRLNGSAHQLSKRIFDLVFSLFALIITLPITLPVAILIKLESKGPVFFKQKRVSKDNKIFEVYKFRTMVKDAEKNTGPVLASKDDNRITKVGKILRKTRIDEIPQFINVLKGEMSLIGPRPERPHFVEDFEENIPDYEYRHRVKSGITGLAQILGYYSSDAEDKLRLDLLYANKSSFVFDIKIILNTIKVMFMGEKSS
ncbi:sugar transferase [Halanaerobium sp. Z-7514]|uniref:Sugar transferase n=1 Tax=Halanaerobium polyolivorans TaxID=2886943 RepID=A0AAW4X1I3_9FIRM|nr:sugar transferase [Halanaerobium polyolivorans]MCC3145671.1 sugar transferase [Halanaerobium polyolivorans]